METLVENLQKQNEEEIIESLQAFCQEHEKKSDFCSSDTAAYKKFISLIHKLLGELHSKDNSDGVHSCVSCLAIMSRNKFVIGAEFTSEIMWKRLSEISGLLEHKNSYLSATKVLSLKCLSNLVFLSETIQNLSKNEEFLNGVMTAILNEKESTSDLQYILLRLLFILTAINEDIKLIVVDECNGRAILAQCLTAVLKNLKSPSKITAVNRRNISVQEGTIINEILKTLFSLNMHLRKETMYEQGVLNDMRDLLSCCRKCLLAKCDGDDNLTMSLHGNAGNVVYSIPGPCFSENLLLPSLEKTSADSEVDWPYEGSDMEKESNKDMSAVLTILNLLSVKVDEPKPSAQNLQPILSLLSCLSQTSRDIRRFCKRKVLPPRKDFKNRPEMGDKLQNKLIKLFTHVNTEVKGVSADFLFVLCKENVDRFVKYTGFGNAAGLLASRGLLAGGKGNTTYSDTDSDSDTEEYKQNVEKIDPVTGYIPPERPNPMAGMTDEQKEYLAVKLACDINKLSSDDIIQPMAVGEDGKLIPIQQKVHQTKLPKDDASDSD